MLGKNDKVDVLILARGGSLRLPLKNINYFCGHPLVAWSIIQARCSKWVNDVYVSTDHDEIASISEVYGAKVIRRSSEACKDHDASAYVPGKDALLKIRNEKEINDFVCLFPTSPLRLPYDIDRMIDKYKLLKVYSLSSFCYSPETLVHQITGRDSARTIISDKRYNYAVSSMGMSIQDVDWVFKSTENVPTTDRECELIEQKEGPVTYCYFGEYWQQHDIDTQTDLEVCEALMEKMILHGKGIDVYLEYREIWGGLNTGWQIK